MGCAVSHMEKKQKVPGMGMGMGMGLGMRTGMWLGLGMGDGDEDGDGVGNWHGNRTQRHNCKTWGNTAQFPAPLHFLHEPSKALSLAGHSLPISAPMF